MVKSGLVYSYGMGFWGPNGHDGVWHIALSSALSRGTFTLPIFSGLPIQNYHIGFDLFLSVLYRVTHIPLVNLYFQVLPFCIVLFVSFSFLWLLNISGRSRSSTFWSLFFLFFGGSFGWIVTLFRGQGFGGESMFWSQQSVSTLINPPFALSLGVIFLSLVSLFLYEKQKKQYLLFVFVILFALLPQIKIYAAVLSYFSFFISSVWRFFFQKKYDFFIAFLIAIFIGALLFLTTNSSSKDLLVFYPFWFLETMIILSDRLGWNRLWLIMDAGKQGNYIKYFFGYGISFILFFVGNFGSRLVSVFSLPKKPSQVHWYDVFFLGIIGGGILLPLFFVQKGTAWNTIQFFYYSLLISSYYAGESISRLLRISVLRSVVIILVVIFTIPTTLSTLVLNYLPDRPPSMISHEQVSALSFLSKQPYGVVLTYPYSQDVPISKQTTPRDLPFYTSTSYVAAFSNKPVFLEDEINLEIMQYPWKERKVELQSFYDSLDQNFVRSFLKNHNITYIYWLKGQRARLGETQLGIERIYENKEVDMYRVIQ